MGIKVRLVPLLWSDDRLECVFSCEEKKGEQEEERKLTIVWCRTTTTTSKSKTSSTPLSGPLQAPRRRGPDLPPREQVRKLLWKADRGRRVDAHLPVLGKEIVFFFDGGASERPHRV